MIIGTEQATVQGVLTTEQIENLPINGRNYINFTLTDSQVVRDNAPNTGAVVRVEPLFSDYVGAVRIA